MISFPAFCRLKPLFLGESLKMFKTVVKSSMLKVGIGLQANKFYLILRQSNELGNILKTA